MAEISRGLKVLAKELDVAVLALSQLNRGPEQGTDKQPQLSDLRESGTLEQDADIVALLHRRDDTDASRTGGATVDLILAKHRCGPTARLCLAVHRDPIRFADPPGP